MRKINIEFTVPPESEDAYSDVCPELVFEDFFGRFGANIGVTVLADTVTTDDIEKYH